MPWGLRWALRLVLAAVPPYPDLHLPSWNSFLSTC